MVQFYYQTIKIIAALVHKSDIEERNQYYELDEKRVVVDEKLFTFGVVL